LGHEPLPAHALRQHALAQRVVDLVGARVGEVLAFEHDLRPADALAEALCAIDGRRPPGEAPPERIELAPEIQVLTQLEVRSRQLGYRRHQRLRYIGAAELAEVSVEAQAVDRLDKLWMPETSLGSRVHGLRSS